MVLVVAAVLLAVGPLGYRAFRGGAGSTSGAGVEVEHVHTA